MSAVAPKSMWCKSGHIKGFISVWNNQITQAVAVARLRLPMSNTPAPLVVVVSQQHHQPQEGIFNPLSLIFQK